MKAKYKFLLVTVIVFSIMLICILGVATYFLSKIFSPTPLKPYEYNIKPEVATSLTQKATNSYSSLFIPKATTETLKLNEDEVEYILMLMSKYLTSNINTKLKSKNNHLDIFYKDNRYNVQFSYYLKNPLPFGNYINLKATLNLAIKDHNTNVKVIKAYCGDLVIPQSIAQEKVNKYMVQKDYNKDMQAEKILKSLYWENNNLVIVYYPKEVLKVMMNYSSGMFPLNNPSGK